MALLVPSFLQTKKYPAARWRQLGLDSALQPGVVGPTDLKVVQRAAGANLSVDIPAGAAWIQGTTSARQGLYNTYNDALVNLTVPTNANASPRLDQVVMRIYDSVDGSAAQDAGTLELIPGTPTSGATLDNRNGAAALPASSIRLADILTPANASSIVSSAIRDRRPWARGAYSFAGHDYGTAGVTTTMTVLTQLTRRVEVTGRPVRVTFRTYVATNAATNASFLGGLLFDGVYVRTGGFVTQMPLANNWQHIEWNWEFPPSAGSHLFGVQVQSASGVTYASPTQLIVSEMVQPSADNGTS